MSIPGAEPADSPRSTLPATPATVRGIDIADRTAFRRFVSLLLHILAAGVLMALVTALMARPFDAMRAVNVATYIVVVALGYLALKRSVELAVQVLATGLWIMNGITIIAFAGIHSVNLMIYPFLIALAGWVLGRRWLVGLSLATITFIVAMTVAEISGAYIPGPRPSAMIVMTTAVIVISIVGFLTQSAFNVFAKSRDEALSMAEQLAHHNIEIARREMQLQMIMDNVPAGIASFDDQYRLRMGNQRYAALFGTEPKAIEGRHIAEFAGPELVANFRRHFAACLRDGAPQHYRRTASDPVNGDKRVIDVDLVPETEHGKVVGAFGLLRDVTDSVIAEQRIRELNDTLELRVAQRTAELQETMLNLQRSQDGLARAERMAALGALVAGVSHELNTPIGNSVMAASTIGDHAKTLARAVSENSLKRSELTAFLEQLREGSALLQRNLHRAEDLLRSFKQVAVDQTSENRRRFDLAEVVREVLDTLAPSLKRQAHRVVADIPAGIDMDSFPGPLGQVLINLINNAYLHAFAEMEQGGIVRLTASPLTMADGSPGVLISVDDNGCGIPENVASRIFEPFFTTRLGQGGTGLGLNISYNIVNGLLGGHIEVHSTSGNGSRFELRIPCNPQAQLAA